MALDDPHVLDRLADVVDRLPGPSSEAVVERVRRRRERRARRRRAVLMGAATAGVLAAGTMALLLPDWGDEDLSRVQTAAGSTVPNGSTPDPYSSYPGPPTDPCGFDSPAAPGGVTYAQVQRLLDREAVDLEQRFGAIQAGITGDPVDNPHIEVVLPSAEPCPVQPVSIDGVPVSFALYGDRMTALVGPVRDVEVVAEGPLPDGRRWRVVSFLTGDDGRCVHLVTPRSGGGGCGAVGDPLQLGQSWTRGYPRFLRGVAAPDVATVAFHLSNGEVVEVEPVDVGHEVTYVVFAVPEGVQVTDVDALDAAGESLPLGEGADRFTTDEEDNAEVEAVFLQWLGAGDDVDLVVSAVEDGEALRATISEALATAPAPPATYTGAVDAVRLVADDRAEVEFRIVGGRMPVLAATGVAVRVDGRWLVSRGTYCETIAVGPVRCPPR